MKNLWLVMPCCLSFSLHACHCCGADDKVIEDKVITDTSSFQQERVRTSPPEQQKMLTQQRLLQQKNPNRAFEEGAPLSVVLEHHLSLEDLNEKGKEREEDEIATVQRVLKARQNSGENLLARGSKLAQSALPGVLEKRRSRRSSVFFSQEIDLDDPLYKEVAREYHEALANGYFGESEVQDENKEFILLVELLKKHSIPLQATLGDVKRLVDAFGLSEQEDEDATIARKTIGQLRHGESFSKDKVFDYKKLLMETIAYVETTEMPVPQEYHTTLSYLERIMETKG